MTTDQELVEHLRWMAVELDDTRRRLGELESRRGEPVAIVGMACRFPGGVSSPEDLWRVLDEGRDTISELPDDRGWDLPELYHADPAHPGTSYTRAGGFLGGAADFDAGFFNVSPREAVAMDPQQRHLLEVGWECLERASIDPARLRGSRTGVFVGSNGQDYVTPMMTGADDLGGYLGIGGTQSVLSGRIAYTFGLEGPAVTVDTACSASLVALHQAVQSLRAGECDLALAGGATVMATPWTLVEFSRQRGLAADGRCKSYSDHADGTAVSEGVGMLLLERVSDARRNGHPVLAVVRGSAVNQDGASNGLTAPSGPAQRRVIEAALAAAGLSAADVDAVEGHGTGTRIGDPIEIDSLIATYGRNRPPRRPLWLGAVKSNLGHTQAAAGVAGVIKMVLALRHGKLPRTLHVDEPSSHVDWADSGVRLLATAQPWPAGDRPRRAGVSSFGISGTNAHVILEQAEESTEEAGPSAPPSFAPWLVSAASVDALRAQSRRLADHVLTEPTLDLVDGGYSTAVARAHLRHRAVVVAADRTELLTGLSAVADGQPAAGVVIGQTGAAVPLVAFLFTGQGAQRPGVGSRLCADFPVFAEAFTAVCREFDALLDRSLAELVRAEPGSPDAALLNETAYTQPALFAVETAMFRLVTSWGLVPAQLIGHSIGELAAAHVAGVLSLADACRLVAARGRLMQRLPAGGLMVSVQAAEDEVRPLLAGREDQVGIAAVNGPLAVVISGAAQATTDIANTLAERGRKTKILQVSHAFHSALMEPVTEEFWEIARTVAYHEPNLPIVSCVTGAPGAPGEFTDPEYWVRHVREPVRFADAVRAAERGGVRFFLELGPEGVLTSMAADCLAEPGAAVLAAGLRKGGSDSRSVLAAVGQAHAAGVPVDWAAVFDGTGARLAPLPTYAFQRQRFWLPDQAGHATGTASPSAARQPEPVTPRAQVRSAGERDRLGLVRAATAAVLGHASADAVAPDTPFAELGVTSLGAVELATQLRAATGLALPSSLVFEHATPLALARYLDERARGADDHRDDRHTGPALRVAVDEPIAIVGMACRFPGGVSSPEDLWRVVIEEQDVLSGFPGNRGWNLDELFSVDGPRGRTTEVREGGFLHDAPDFDAAFFGISPREALTMDPQHRLLLETGWEALECAGIDPVTLRGSRTGVFAGLVCHDYLPGPQVMPDELVGYFAGGIGGSIATGRLAYTFGFEGPAVTVDSACSSALVALHQAMHSLRTGECDLALAGGVTVTSTPGAYITFSRQSLMAPDARCKSFAEAADGSGWSEGVGMLLVERLSDARRDGHRVLAVVRGSAVNQDGASNGLMAPSGPAQRAVIRAALASAGLSAWDVDVVEAHGTGTRLGDPIEANAVLATYGQERDIPLWLGSVKSNIGHTQGAAGVAGVIKMVMALRHGLLPRSLHIDQPSSHVDWSAGRVSLLTETRPWPESGRPRRAAVSAFGASGTNAHVILEQAPAETEPAPAEPVSLPLTPLVVSARSPEALRAQAARLAELLRRPDAPGLTDLGWSLVTTRTVHEHRAVLLAADPAEALAGLDALAEGQQSAHVVTGEPVGSADVVFVFPGQGSQWPGMAVELMEHSETFRAALVECDQALAEFCGFSVIDAMRAPAQVSSLDEMEVVQPVLFAVMSSLARAWQAAGVTPSAVVGHSQGELTAAYVAGALSLRDAARAIVLRSRIIKDHVVGKGGMVSIAKPAAWVRERLEPWADRLSVGVVNGPESVVVSGDFAAVDEFVEVAAAAGARTRRVRSAVAPGHSPVMELIRDQVISVLAELAPRESAVPLCSTVTGEILDTSAMDAKYWFRNLREPVLFANAVDRLVNDGHRIFVEVSPHPLLPGDITDVAAWAGRSVAALGTLRRDDGGFDRFLRALAEAFVHGAHVDWRGAVFADSGARVVELPTYAFQRDRYWFEPITAPGTAGAVGVEHPMLDAALELAGGGVILTGRLSPRNLGWLADHGVGDVRLLPGAGFVELAIRAGDEVGCGAVDELMLLTPLVITDRAVTLQVVVGDPDGSGHRLVEVFSREEADAGEWVLHAQGQLSPERPADVAGPSGGDWPPDDATALDVTDAYARIAGAGIAYGAAFQGLTAAWQRGDEFFAEVVLPETERAGVAGYGVHPALLDAALHVIVLDGLADSGQLAFAWSGVTLHSVGATALRVRATRLDDETFRLRLTDAADQPVLTAESVAVRRIAPQGLAGGRRSAHETLFSIDWAPVPPTGGQPVGRWVVLGQPAELPWLTDVDSRNWHPDLAALGVAVDAGDPVPEVVVVPVVGAAPDDWRPVHEVLSLCQRWADDTRWVGARLVVLSRQAVSTGPDDPLADVIGASVGGFVRSAQQEQLDRFVLLDAGAGAVPGVAISAALATGEPQLALRGGVLLTPRLARLPHTAGDDDNLAAPAARDLDPDGTVLITGGTGTLGSVLARHLVASHGIRHLLLVSRRGPAAANSAELRAQLCAAGAEVTIAACDVADPDAVARLLAEVPNEHPLTGVFHLTGALADGTLANLTPAAVDAVMRPKAGAAWQLHRLTRDLGLAEFVLYSSTAGPFGSAGQGNYGAANAYLDALAHHRRAEGLPARSLAWGLWEQRSGMAGELTEQDLARRLARAGARALSNEQGMAALDVALRDPHPALVAARFDFATLRAQASDGTLPALFRGLVRARPRRMSGAASAAGFQERLAGLPPAERLSSLVETVRATVAVVLGHAGVDAFGETRALREIGLDSLTAVDLRNRLGALTGLKLPATLAFDHPTSRQVAERLDAELFGTRAEARPAVFTDLDRLELALLGLTGDEAIRAQVTMRLHSIVAKWRDSAEPTAEVTVGEAGIADASVGELFDFIDNMGSF